MDYYKKCLKIQEKQFGLESIQVATTLNNIGSLHDDKCEYEKAS